MSPEGDNSFETIRERGTKIDDQEKEFTSFIKDHFNAQKLVQNSLQIIDSNGMDTTIVEMGGDKEAIKLHENVNLKKLSLDLDFYDRFKSPMKS